MNNDERHSDTEYVEDYRPSSEELSLLRGDAGLEKGSRQPVNHSDSPSEPESALQISEIEKSANGFDAGIAGSGRQRSGPGPDP